MDDGWVRMENEGWMGGWMDVQVAGWTGGWMDRWMYR